MFDFIVSTKLGYTHASLSDFSGYAAFDSRTDGDDSGCRISGVVRHDGVTRRSGFRMGTDSLWGDYFKVFDDLEKEVQP